ncbi:MAG: hypothetical protein ACR2GY_12490 [Phycisphaerales bacterium]
MKSATTNSPRDLVAEMLIIAALCVGGWAFFVDSRQSELAEIEAQLATVNAISTETIEHSFAQFADESRALKQLVRDVDRRNRFVADAAVLFESIMQYAREQDVVIDRLTPTISSNHTAGGAQQIARLSLSIEGSYEAITSFVAGLSELHAFIVPISIRLSPISDQPGRCTGLVEVGVLSFPVSPSLLAALTEVVDDAE